MSQPARATSTRKLIIATILIAAAVGSATGFATSILFRTAPPLESRIFYLFASDLSFPFNQTSGDNALTSDYSYSTNYIMVNKGDTLTIHFYNPTDERHSFNMGAPYAKNNVTLDAGPTDSGPANPIHDATITINANQAGTFQFFCIFHRPQMRGWLLVQG